MQPARAGRMPRAGRVIVSVLLVVCGVAALAVLALPLLVAALVSMPATPSDALKHGVGEQARAIAYSLRNQHVRAAIDRGASRARIAGLTETTPLATARLRAIGIAAVDAGAPVLLAADRVGSSGSAVDFAWGGTIGGEGEFGPPERPWVTCLRVELPATKIDATEWSVRDVDCPTFSAIVRKDAVRIHAADFTTTPLLRPPCYGTTGYCPGG